MHALVRTDKHFGSPLLDAPFLAPYAHLGMWRARCIVGTSRGNRRLVREAVERLYYHHGREASPWIVWCDGPFQLCAMRQIFPRVLASPLWSEISRHFRHNVYPGDEWEAQWQRLLETVIKPLIHDTLISDKYRIACDIPERFDRDRMIGSLLTQLHDELERRLRSEARQSDSVVTRTKRDLRMPEVDAAKWRAELAQRFPLMRFELNGLSSKCGPIYKFASFDGDAERETLEILGTDAANLARIFSTTIAEDWTGLLKDSMANMITFAWELPFLPRYTLFRPHIQLEFNEDKHDELENWALLAEHCGHMIFTDAITYVCRKPNAIRYDSSRRFDSSTGPAVEWADGFALYAIRNVAIKPRFIMEPDSLTVEDIDTERNSEIRSRLLDLFGLVRYLAQTNAEMVHSDECGELWMRTQMNGEALMMVKVRNSTPEPDGSIKDYVLRVPPHVRTARDAVAWTFGMTEYEYKPQKET